MFTGIIEEVGTVKAVTKGADRFAVKISAETIMQDLKKGDSICVDGVCLTVKELDRTGFSVDVMTETIRLTTVSTIKPGDRVNLERALTPSSRLSGHFVTGHVDGMGKIERKYTEGNSVIMEISAGKNILDGIVKKGSIAVDGISVTVADLTGIGFVVSLVPFTVENTNLKYKKPVDRVNLETDMIGKYVAKYLLNAGKKSDIDMSILAENGFV